MIELKPTDALSSKNNGLGRNVLQDVYDGNVSFTNKCLGNLILASIFRSSDR